MNFYHTCNTYFLFSEKTNVYLSASRWKRPLEHILQSVAMQRLSRELSIEKLYLLGLGPHLSRIQNKVRYAVNVEKNDCLTIRDVNFADY